MLIFIVLLIVLFAVGIATQFAPMDQRMKNIVYAASGVTAFFVILMWVLSALGLFHGTVPQLNLR